MSEPKLPMLRLRVSAPAERYIRNGHPWIYSDSIVETNRTGDVGEMAVVYNRDNKFMALGLYDPQSPIRLRVLHSGKPVKEVTFTPGDVPAKVDPNGTYQVEQMYVQYFLPANEKGAYPLLMWHGGGLTGVSGAGARPGSVAGDLAGAGWPCPIAGISAFADTWGQARSGGRTHQGVDMIAARGTPIVAVVDGFAQSKVNTLGGNTISLSGADGNRYYYAHLDSWAALGQVTVGTVIGYVGDTGNAKFSTPHLHFEIHPGGGPAVNPYATVRNHC